MEAGRWHKPTKISCNERKCKICNNVQDEFHFCLNVLFILIIEKNKF